HVLQAAALLGEVFDRITLNHMISGSTLAHKLTELSEKGWLQKSDGVNPSQYHFNHTLTRESIYSTLVRSKKQLLHQRAGEAIEFLYPESQEENLENLAYHFENSGLQDKSLYYSIRAAEKCTRRFALEESRGYYRKAEAILDQRYQPQSRMMHRVILGQTDVFLSQGEPTKVVNSVQKVLSGSKELSRIMHAACLRRLGAAWRMQGDMIAALEKYEQALEIIDSAKGREMQLGGKTVVSDEEERIDIQIGLSRVYFDTQRTVDAKELARRALDSFNQDRYPGKAARLYNLLAGIYYREGDIDQALALSERGLAIYQANGFRDGASDTYSNLGILSVAKQDHGVAQDYFSLALELHEALGDIEGNAITRNNLGQLATTRGNIVEAINHLGFSIRFARLSELNRTLTQALTNLGYAFTMTGELDQALESFTEAENLCGTHRYGDLLGEMLWKKSECLIALDDIDAAIETAKYALDQAGELKRRDIEAQALRVYARSLRIRGDIEDARDIAKEAWQMVEMDHDPHKRAKFVIDYALVLTAKNQHAEAIDLIEKHVRSVSLVETEHILRELTDAFGELIDLNSGFGNR
ncbi:MAG: tetratricopeptide repeat protein, partial [Chloroflexi bacterium]|nr:tetratricopeptide repeat protein [Chloroflexota bacterium]